MVGVRNKGETRVESKRWTTTTTTTKIILVYIFGGIVLVNLLSQQQQQQQPSSVSVRSSTTTGLRERYAGDDFDDFDDDFDDDDEDDDEDEDIADRKNNDDRPGEKTKRHDVKVVPDKIFAIGFKKTGTSSLNLMYEPLIEHFGGTRPKGNGKAARNVAEEKSREVVERDALKLASKHTYFQGSPWCAEPHRLWETLAVAYPTSRFVLTTRDPDAWYDSILRYVDCGKSTGKKTSACGDEKLEKYRILFGADGTSRREFRDAMESHNAAIRSRFEDEPHRLLETDLTTNSASPSKVWEVFCEFAGLPADRCPTDREIPHENKQSAAAAAGAAAP